MGRVRGRRDDTVLPAGNRQIPKRNITRLNCNDVVHRIVVTVEIGEGSDGVGQQQPSPVMSAFAEASNIDAEPGRVTQPAVEQVSLPGTGDGSAVPERPGALAGGGGSLP